jgi:hypothetical protein
MKKVFLAFVLVFVGAGAAHSYDNTLISDETEIGGFIAPVTRFMEVRDEFGLLVGGRIGAVINHTWCIGLGGYGVGVDPTPEDLEGLEDLTMAYGGLFLEYVLKPHSVVHICVPILVGGGQIQFEGDYVDPESGDDSEAIFVVEPEVNLEFNITRNLRLNLGAGYRHVSRTDLVDFSDEDLSGVNGAITFKIGSF